MRDGNVSYSNGQQACERFGKVGAIDVAATWS